MSRKIRLLAIAAIAVATILSVIRVFLDFTYEGVSPLIPAAGVVFAAATLILGYDIYTLHSLSANGFMWGKFWVLILVFAAWLSVYFIYVCAYIARFEAPLPVIVSNSLKLSISHLPVTLALIVVVAAVVLGVWLWPKTLAFLPTVGMLLCTRLIAGVFRRYMTEEERNAEDEKNESWKLLRKSMGSK